MKHLTAFGVFYRDTTDVNRAIIKEVFENFEISRATLLNYRTNEYNLSCMKAYVAEKLIERIPELRLILSPKLEAVDTEPLGV